MPKENTQLHIWLAYVNYPITTAVYLKRALQQMGHQVTTIGPRLPEKAIALWGLQNMKLPLDPQDIDTSFTPDMAEIWELTAPSERPDLYLWVESVNGHNPQNLQQITCPKVCYLIDTHYHLDHAIEIAQQFDYVFIAQLVDLEEFRTLHPQVHWLPLACDPEIHGRQKVSKEYEVSFVGGMNERRAALLDHLAGRFNVHHERSFWTDMARTFSASRIVLNDASYDDLNMRFFEALAAGSLLLSNPTNGSGQDILFHDGAEYACHHDHDLLEIVQRYLDNEPLRERIAEQGRQRVLAAHTYQHRMIDLLEVISGRKQDTFSTFELRERSHTGPVSPDAATPVDQPRIRSIISTRNVSQWPTFQMVHEWEDILGAQLGVPFRPLDDSCLLPAGDTLEQGFDLLFLPLASELADYTRNRSLIPVVMDLWRDGFDAFIRCAPQFRLVFVTNLQAYQELSPQLPNLRYLPFTLADQYLDCTLPAKDIDIIHYGRRNPVLDQYLHQFLQAHPACHAVITDKSDNGEAILIHSNRWGNLGVSDSRKKFMDLLCRSRISLVSTVGMDGSRQTGGIDPVSPRFLESMAAGCHLVGRIPDNPEFRDSGLFRLCHHVDSYQQFEKAVLALLAEPANPQRDYRPLLAQRLTSSLVPIIRAAVSSLHNNAEPHTPTGGIMHCINPRTDLEDGLKTLKAVETERPSSAQFSNYQAMADVIAYHLEFHGLDCFDLFTTIQNQQKQPTQVLLIAALELSHRGQADAACSLAYRAMQMNPADSDIALFYADQLRRAGRFDEARAIATQHATDDTGFKLSQAVLDTCEIDETLPLRQEHYHLLHAAHTLLRPRRYVEIGICSGKSLALTKRGTAAIGVDPMTACVDQQFYKSPENSPALFQMTSNDFFEQGLMEKEWDSKPFDMAFIDGLHLFEQALMDFIHLEHRSAPDSIIFMHDGLPVNIIGAERKRTSMVWTGDVWKVILCLKTVRPDLEITTFPVRPSGLTMIRKLDRNSKLLATQFDTLVAHFMDAELPASLPERFQLLKVTDEAPELTLQKVAAQQGAFQ